MSTSVANLAEIPERKLSALQKSVVALCAAIVFVEGVNAQAAGYIAPALMRDWNLSSSALTSFLLSGVVGLMLGGLFIAPLADKIGRRPILLGCVALFGICSIAGALSASIAVLNAFRFLTGVGVGGAMANAISLTAEYSPQRRRSSMIAVMLIGFIGGSIAVGFISAWLVPAWGWKSVFVVGGSLSLVLLPLLFVALPESVRFLVLKNEERPSSSISIMALFRDGRARTTVLLWTIYFMSLLNLYLVASWLTTHITALGIAVGVAILIGTMFQIGGAFGSIFGWMVDRLGPRITIFTAYLIAAVAIGCIGLAESNLVLLGVSTLAAGFGTIGGQTAANALAAMSYPTPIRSTGVGWATGIGRIGSIVGPGVAGIFLEMGVSTQQIFYLAVIPAICASLAGAALGARRTDADQRGQ